MWHAGKLYSLHKTEIPIIGGSGGGACPAHAPPYGTQFFHFHIHFHQKVPTSEVHAPLMGARPPTGNPGSATANAPENTPGPTKEIKINKRKEEKR